VRNPIVLSRQTLGTVALSSLAAAAVSFAIVDQSTSISRSCASAASACAHEAVPAVAIAFAVIGAVALVVGIVPAVMWLVLTIRSGHAPEEEHGDDLEETAERHRRALNDD
jgi:hypothetical protein